MYPDARPSGDGASTVEMFVETPADRPRARWGLAALFTLSGMLHLVAPGVYEPIVPGWAGDARLVVLGSGVAELAGAALLARRRSASLGGWYSAALLIAVWPANLKMALDGGILAWLRLPLQIPLIWVAVLVGRTRRIS
ncbi:MAG: membrane protein [Acidimicrobiales bacterium]